MKYLELSQVRSHEAKRIEDRKLTVLEYWRGLFQFSMLQKITLTARNRLQDASVDKLVFLFFNAKNFDAEDVEFYGFMENMADASCDEEINNCDEEFEYY
ncbi:hypothetical protein PHYSODRAFT_336727 [Phytophthora sojae]|uniref:Uncharacterized protein n=1 Tax=Phytophthora sojae (strain P6497) TaxID=1094619 RepID=G4ZVV5_PHYSP|nr:hypothetical protein PHYSODRAFT_336727 [Phytophthora sojae]EGZ12291.1 hypothetical protein PHYSODRAFT_336727 [Phytophthora sojae]|eukprot:XP_009532624.1 hypothetical protein PHYSODRAFT_336727 [Phytophthora sojae]